MHVRPLLSVLPLLSALVLGLDGCGGKDEAGMPPLTPEPGDSRLADLTAPAKDSYPARLVLYKFLRGVAAGNVKACALLTPDYDRAAFGRPGGCRAGGLAAARRKLRPADLAALRGVTVPTCEDGPDEGEYTVAFGDLKWKGDPARPGGVLAAKFTLRKTGTRWLVAG
ncbi:hypothetical protein [Actinomadura opuntiae]|uniref:hypothetical protein n=1 Tax=Actinomadura sp. OS1-43 TaxID=604315 RepID=UPI00255AF907|nr:hypothetical protein [Actinomadura sp. OS1-43]MDL4814617.1 hypothetical protein [Actinomadura sp. OS1-43]